LPIHSNIFPSKRDLREQNLKVDLYRIEGIPRDDNHFRNLSKIIEIVSRQLGVLVVPYSPREKDYGMALEPTIAKTFGEIEKHLVADLDIVRWLDLLGARRLIARSLKEKKPLFKD